MILQAEASEGRLSTTAMRLAELGSLGMQCLRILVAGAENGARSECKSIRGVEIDFVHAFGIGTMGKAVALY